MITVTVSSKGQIVLPKGVRQALGLLEGDRLEVVLEGQTESQEHKCFVSFINLGEVYFSLYRK